MLGCDLGNLNAIVGTLKIIQKGITKLPRIDVQFPVAFKWLAVCGKYYLIVHDIIDSKSVWEVYTKEKFPKYDSAMNGRLNSSRLIVQALGNFSVQLLELSRKLNAPVFSFSNEWSSDNIIVDTSIPVLGNIGFPNIISAQQLYQEISYFMGNVIKTSPDLAPPTTMSDKEKIVQHGFDVRKSFRHRV